MYYSCIFLTLYKRPVSRSANQKPSEHLRTASVETKTPKPSTPLKQEQRRNSTAQPTTLRATLSHNGKEGKDFPEIRSSKIDINAVPKWPPDGKNITEIDIDADLAENSKLWRLPGTDQTDFFNYGFDEYTWVQYCMRQQNMTDTITDMKQLDAQMKAMFGGTGSGSAADTMPSMDEMQFLQMMMGGGGPMPGMPGPAQQPGQVNMQNQGGFGAQPAGGFGAQPQNTMSPLPQAGQGFQPPSGPSGGQNQQGEQAGFAANMEGYSPQQIAIMQQQQSNMGGQGGRRGRNRGRGFY
jgi:pre-mRNA 3'-end-processing factor FIP1